MAVGAPGPSPSCLALATSAGPMLQFGILAFDGEMTRVPRRLELKHDEQRPEEGGTCLGGTQGLP